MFLLLVSALTYGEATLELAQAAINEKINYQGKLTDASDVAVADGNYSIVFSLYTAPTGGTNIWTETQSVAVTNGLFSVMLGTTTSLSNVDFNQTLYLGVNVAGDGEMTPRRVLGAVPAAFVAESLSDFATPFAAQLAATTTDALAQGSTNRYYSDALVNAYIHASSTVPKTYTSNTWIGTNTWTGLSSFGNASTTLLSSLDAIYVGRTSTTTIRGDNATSTFNGFIDVLGTGANATSTFSANLWVKGGLQVGTGSIHLSDSSITHSGGGFSIAATATTTLSNLGFVVGTNQLAVQSGSSYVGIGTSTPSEKLTLTGGNFRQIPSNPVVLGSIGVGGTPNDLDVVSNRAYVVDESSDDLKVFDVSTSTPALITSVALGAAPRAVTVAGRYAYVADNGVKIFDITLSPPVLVGTLATTTPRAMFVQGRYLYAAAEVSTNSFYIADVADPTNPQVIGYLTTGYIDSVVVYGTYAYVTTSASGSGNSYIIDVTNPVTPLIVKTVALGSISSNAVVDGSYAYTVSSRISGLNTLTELKIVDIDPVSSAAVVSTLLLNTDASLGTDPVRIRMAGRYAYVTDANVGANDGELTVVDISNPVNPTIVGELTITAGGGSVGDLIPRIAGRYLYVLEKSSGDELHKIDISGAEMTSVLAHSLEAGGAQIRNDLFVGNQLKVGSGLNVGTGGIYSSGPLSVGVATTTASNQLSAYFAGLVGIGTTSPQNPLAIVGALDNTTSATTTALVYLQNTQTGANDNKVLYAEAANRTGFIAELLNANTNAAAAQKGLRITLSPAATGANSHFIGFSHNGAMGGMIQGNGSGGVTYTTTGSDYAEYFLAAEIENKPEKGDLVAWSPDERESVAKTNSSGEDKLIGVVSTAPGFIGNSRICPPEIDLDECHNEYRSRNVLVALMGRAPTKVNLEGGEIAIGDRISASSVSGVGKKALPGETNIGFALEPFTGSETDDEGIGKILVFINLQTSRLDPDFTARGQFASSLFSVRALKSLADAWEINEDGVLRVREVRTDKLCLGKTCLTESTLHVLLKESGQMVEVEEEETEEETEEHEQELPPEAPIATSTTEILPDDPAPPTSDPESNLEEEPIDDEPESQVIIENNNQGQN